MNFNRPLILASKSPRRQQLLQSAGFEFEVKALDVDESFPDNLPAHLVAKYIAEKKASASRHLITNELLITADTVVIVDDTILGKPQDAKEAKEMLIMMSGRKHTVMTGVAIVSTEQVISFDDTTIVTFKTLSNEEIDYYVENFKPFDKAGAYGIQEWIGMIGIEHMEGSFFNVVGLPIDKVYKHLMAME